MNEKIEELFQREHDNPRIWLRVASERLSLLRYVFLVQIEDGIPDADQRSCLEYADAVLIGWPDEHADDVYDLDQDQLNQVRHDITVMEERVPVFRKQEQEGRIADMSDSLIAITGCVAQVRQAYQPGFPLPTYSEIRRVVQEEWNADMERIDPDRVNPSAEQMRQEAESENAENASEARREGEQA
ncbi:phosphoribosylglycinamide synthetase [Bifidobacterium sp. W8109]|uniref:phosphoribosylglycinamide synthetase n=1 Tax=Bifidobacterium TaxID=1678 RepID=UPI0018DD6CDA|nr:phosphoribosylglycinamide synthetase [Bifidobacterium asteroides]MBI0073496.1 phosphoribosylglycinamide synthetase [Bifidobacterium sp. W8110]